MSPTIFELWVMETEIWVMETEIWVMEIAKPNTLYIAWAKLNFARENLNLDQVGFWNFEINFTLQYSLFF